MRSCSIPGDKPHQIDAKVNNAMPQRKVLLSPNRSPNNPPISNSEEMKSAYASTTHCACAPVAASEVCRLGSATFTTVPSMNSMLDPRIVAASTQCFEDIGRASCRE